MSDDRTQPEGTPKPEDATSGAHGDEYWQAEAKRAFAVRDELKKRLRELETRTLNDDQVAEYQALKEQAAKAEEERKRKAGEFDTWRAQIADKHKRELDDVQQRVSALSDRFKQTVVKAEFGGATQWFGGDTARTILDPELAMAALGKYVRVEDVDDDPLGYRVTVVDTRGNRILGRDGSPAPFADAIGELIAMLPNRDRILRGSGKTGSGSSGGSDAGKPADLDTLIARAQTGDREAVKALARRQAAAGGMEIGAGFKRVRDARAS